MLEDEILILQKDETKKPKEGNPKPYSAQICWPAWKDQAGKDNQEFSCQSSSWEWVGMVSVICAPEFLELCKNKCLNIEMNKFLEPGSFWGLYSPSPKVLPRQPSSNSFSLRMWKGSAGCAQVTSTAPSPLVLGAGPKWWENTHGKPWESRKALWVMSWHRGMIPERAFAAHKYLGKYCRKKIWGF